MSLLSYDELRALQDAGVVLHSAPEHVNSASIDVTLGPVIMREEDSQWPAAAYREVVLRDRYHLAMLRHEIPKEGVLIRPGEFILAQTEQVFNLPLDLSAEYKLKSSMARNGLNHFIAGWCDAGWNGSVLTLELVNQSRFHAIRLHVGVPIGQVIFFRHRPVPVSAGYGARGRYNGDLSVQGAK